MHVVQYQCNESRIGPNYAFDVVIFDAQSDSPRRLGKVQKQAVNPKTNATSVDSTWPDVVVIKPSAFDDSPVKLRYGVRNGTLIVCHIIAHLAKERIMGTKTGIVRAIWIHLLRHLLDPYLSGLDCFVFHLFIYYSSLQNH